MATRQKRTGKGGKELPLLHDLLKQQSSKENPYKAGDIGRYMACRPEGAFHSPD